MKTVKVKRGKSKDQKKQDLVNYVALQLKLLCVTSVNLLLGQLGDLPH